VVEISAKNFHAALTKINRVVPYLANPLYPSVVIDVKAEQMRVANSVQFWQTNAPGIPNMQLVADKAQYLADLLAGRDEAIAYTDMLSSNDFLVGPIGISLVKPLTSLYNGIEEVLLKPVLANDYTLTASSIDFLAAVLTVEDGTHPRAIRLQLSKAGVIVTGKDANGNLVSVGVAGEYNGPDYEAFFPAKELRVLASTIEDKTTNFIFGHGARFRPAPLLATDEASGLTVVLSPTHQ
jgi:hypothetical protein